jgi:hypothetical protein
MTARRGTTFSKGRIIILLAGFFVKCYLTRMFVLDIDHICNLSIV